jgi:MFS family permease
VRWTDHLRVNLFWLGVNVGTGSLTPVILPFLVAAFVPAEAKNTTLAEIRVASLAVAMFIQPLSGLLSDRSTSRWGRRGPFMALGAVLATFCLGLVGLAQTVAMLLVSIVLYQFGANLAVGGLQGLIPDLVPESQRGRTTGVKALFELVLPAFFIAGVGPLLDARLLWVALVVVAAVMMGTMLGTVLTVHETPLRRKSAPFPWSRAGRIVLLTLIFVGVTQISVRLVTWVSARSSVEGPGHVVVVGLAGLLAMAASIVLGVYVAGWVGIGPEAREHPSFLWWIINRLLFLTAVGSLQGFAQYYLSDAVGIENAASATTLLALVIVVSLVPASLLSGALSDRLGRKPLIGGAALVAALGCGLLVVSRSMASVLVAGGVLGIGTGAFWSTNWALGTELAPREQAGRFLGISNLAGAGAGIVGVGIGGPLVDYLNIEGQGLGYLVIIALYGVLLVLSAVTLLRVREPTRNGQIRS